jgi:TRAP-type C4-dicarboxylate transport system permease small subunit
MDSMGDAAELGADELSAEDQPFLTDEARAITAAALVLAGLLATGLFQYLSFFVVNRNGDSVSPTLQFAFFAGPSGVLAGAGAVLAWPVRRSRGNRVLHGLAVASIIVGIVIAVAVTMGIVVAATESDGTF